MTQDTKMLYYKQRAYEGIKKQEKLARELAVKQPKELHCNFYLIVNSLFLLSWTQTER